MIQLHWPRQTISLSYASKFPTALNIVRKYRQKLLDDEVADWGFGHIQTHVKKPAEQYHQHVSQVIAAKQLIKQGTEVHAGNSVRFLFTHSKDKRHGRRVKAAQLIEKGVEPDTEKILTASLFSGSKHAKLRRLQTDYFYDSIRDKKTKKSSCDSEDCLWWKLRFDKSKRRYKNGRKIYSYDRITLVFPREYYDLLNLPG